MLAPGQKFEWKEWMENHSGKSKTTNPILAESEEKLREILSKLDRNPTGILSDFDLHAKHTSAVLPEVAVGPTGAPIGRSAISFLDSGAPGTVGSHVANVLGKDDLVETPTSKRRKTNSGSSIASISHTAPETGSRGLTSCSERVSKLEEGKQRLVDFRTGTPAFMSLRVLEVTPGTPYYHSFLDDLESFFWLIFWCAMAHLDDDSRNPTQKAQKELDLMDQCDLDVLANWKGNKLSQCSRKSGRSMKNLLESFGNGWASHRIFVNVIIGLGCFFSEVDYESLSETTPAAVFSRFVNIIINELDQGE
ncbi:hypothetical protein CTheo_9115 [Ceratobasidium theobromae]|uniref:Fungal-type protein kinase domain-containing protein n=1 Tax=Ceratobasidium theobromae TaxID=1582974 RepID=A0A5N5Q7S7_9AGAM|nr:hypothetical protein CTheo_9115 [Ceratobasidium theobromae]